MNPLFPKLVILFMSLWLIIMVRARRKLKKSKLNWPMDEEYSARYLKMVFKEKSSHQYIVSVLGYTFLLMFLIMLSGIFSTMIYGY